MPIFTPDEINRRLDAVREALTDADCAIAFSFHNSYYLSGSPMPRWGREQVVLVFRDSDPIVITPGFEITAVQRNSPIADIRPYWDDEGPSHARVAELVMEAAKERGVRTAGVELGGVSASLHADTFARLPDVEVVDVTRRIDDLRLVSSPEELELSRTASTVATAGMRALIDGTAAGASESELQRIGREAVINASPERVSITSAVYMQQGLETFEPHLQPIDNRIAADGIVELVVEVEAWHYQASPERCVVVGHPPAKVEDAVKVMLEAFHRSRDQVAAGNTFASVDKAARDIFFAHGHNRMASGSGFVRSLVHHTGGRVDQSNFRIYNDEPLRSNMVVTVEPWALIPDVGAPRHCDQLLVTEDGYEVLTPVDDGLIRR